MKSKTPPPPERLGHLTISKLAMMLGHTVPAMRKHLTAMEILGPDGKPSEAAVAAGLAKSVAGEDFRDRTKTAHFWVYDADHIVPRAPKGDVAERMARISSVDQARDRIESIFVYALKALKAPADFPKQRSWAREAGLDKSLIGCLEELAFQDMHFLGGPFVFEMIDKPEQTMQVKERARPLREALQQLMMKSGLTEQADVFARSMDMLFSNVQSKLEEIEAKQQASLSSPGRPQPKNRRIRP